MSPIELYFPKKIRGLFVVWEGRNFQIETRCEFFKFIFRNFQGRPAKIRSKSLRLRTSNFTAL